MYDREEASGRGLGHPETRGMNAYFGQTVTRSSRQHIRKQREDTASSLPHNHAIKVSYHQWAHEAWWDSQQYPGRDEGKLNTSSWPKCGESAERVANTGCDFQATFTHR